MAATTDKRQRNVSGLAWHFLWPLLILGVFNLLWGDYIGPKAEEQWGDKVIYTRNCTYASEAWYLLVCEGNASLGAARAVQRTVGENQSPYKDDCIMDSSTQQIHCRVTPGVRGWYNGPLAILNLPTLILTGPLITSFNTVAESYLAEEDPSNIGSLIISAGVLLIWPLWMLAAISYLFRPRPTA